MSSPISGSRIRFALASLTCLVACSYDLDRFVGSGAGGASITSAGSDTTGAGSGAMGGATTGGEGGGSGGAGGVGGAAGTSGADASGDAGAKSPDAADAAASDDRAITGDADDRDAITREADVLDAANEATSMSDASTDALSDRTCQASDCGSCTNTADCSCALHGGHVYRFCAAVRSWSDAQTQCAIVSMRLARVDDLFENAWIRSTADMFAMGESWIGIQDPMKTLNWQWADGTAFWMGDSNGTPVGGLYNAWGSGRPTGNSTRSCASMLGSASSGQWFDRSCTSLLSYVCELY
jgi:hypothetical protein